MLEKIYNKGDWEVFRLNENILKEIKKERNKQLGMSEPKTEEVFKSIIDNYKKLLLDSPRNVVDYEISIVLSNANGFSDFGKITHLYQIYNIFGDIFFINVKESSFFPIMTDEEGVLDENIEDISFIDKDIFPPIEKQKPFSIKEFIQICEQLNVYVNLHCYESSQSDVLGALTITVKPYRIYNRSNEGVECYLDSIAIADKINKTN